jgi:hypothetical protein
MGSAYAIVGSGGEWRIRRDDKDENVYQTKESAFEAAVAAASLALRQGHEVQISSPRSDTATGAANAGAILWPSKKTARGYWGRVLNLQVMGESLPFEAATNPPRGTPSRNNCSAVASFDGPLPTYR